MLCVPLMVCAGPDSLQIAQLKPEEIEDLKQLASYNKTWNVFLNVWALLGPILGALATWLGITKMIEKWAEEQITIKANEKFGVDWAIVKLMVDREKQRMSIRQKRIAVFNKSTGKRKDLVDVLKNSDFDEKNIYFYLLDSILNFDDNRHDIILIDNSDSQLSDLEMEDLIEKKKNQFKFVVLAGSDVSFYSKYPTTEVKIIKNPEYIADNLEQMLLKKL